MDKFLYHPLKKFIISQKFGENANGSYADNNLKGHTGIDLESFYGDDIMSASFGKLYKAINFQNPNLSFYRCVFTLVQNGKDWYEVSYGHCSAFLSVLGTNLKTGEVIAGEGNTGIVYANGVLVPEKLKELGNKSGTHVHFQVRKVERTLFLDMQQLANGEYLISQNNSNPYKDDEGFYYHTINYFNGYNGCIDPSPLLTGISADQANVAPELITELSDITNSVSQAPISSSDKSKLLDSLKVALIKIANFFGFYE